MNKSAINFIFTREGFIAEIKEPGNAGELGALFEKNRYEALYRMGFENKPAGTSPSEEFMYRVAEAFFEALTDIPELELAREKVKVKPSDDIIEKILGITPFAIGSEFIDRKWIRNIFKKLEKVFSEEIAEYDGTVAVYLTEKNQSLHVPERIFFHLVEAKDSEFPFAFLATYATSEKRGRIKHVPLKYALTEYKNDRAKLIELLSCLNRAAEVSPLIEKLVASGEMFHPLRLTSEEAYEFLKDIEKIEEAGILCRIPNWWKKQYSSLSMNITLGEEKTSMLGLETIISVKPQLYVNGENLTADDIKNLLEQTDGLAMIKGKWVEVNHARLEKLLADMEDVPEEISMLEALRMNLDGAEISPDINGIVSNGKWLAGIMNKIKKPEKMKTPDLPTEFNATLRPYQKTGYAWLKYMGSIGFGACIADDMGLGKTVQVLAYLEKMREENRNARVLLVVPASLLANWKKESEKFTPGLDIDILHGRPASALNESLANRKAFLTVTTYGMASRIERLKNITWDCIILDEAQAIKNPVTKQTRRIKELKGKMKIAMTGTPIENNLTNLWSLFDFLNKGMLGSSDEFKKFCKNLGESQDGYARLKSIVAPFMLRRVKTDKSIISDLPEKIEKIDYTELSKKQTVLYRKTVMDLADKIEELSGMERRGAVLATIMKLKQICNHPDQYLGQTEYSEADSGKFGMLREICETVYEKRERVLVFTQFKEMTQPIADFLEEIFGTKGYVLHGSTPVSKRGEIVEAFQGEKYVPFIVLSVKAGGTGLNLTNANHVIHFDRWWNPAVENQATDRAFRIGQKKNVMVHKLVCSSTIEEKIDAIIESKKELAENVIGSGGENWITEMSNKELLSILKLG